MTDLMLDHWEKLKAPVLDSVSSPITKRVYNMLSTNFWPGSSRLPGFTKATVSAWRVSLEDRKLGSSSMIIRMSAIRKLAAEAADNGLLAPGLAAGISRVKSAKCVGIRVGNRAILSVLMGCGLRRSEVAALTFAHVQQRDGRWCIVDLVGKRGRVRTSSPEGGGFTYSRNIGSSVCFACLNQADTYWTGPP